MNTKLLIGLSILILIMFFFPKNAGSTCGFCPSLGIYKNEYDCFGLKYSYQPKNCLDCGSRILCFGIVTGERKCYGNTVSQRDVEMPCDFNMEKIVGCSSDSDCIAGDSCCHPQKCVNKDYATWYVENNCKGIQCTAVCADCPLCSCVDNICRKVGTQNVSEGACC